MNIFHKELRKKWCKYTLHEQMANIGAEVGRTISWRDRDALMSRNAFYRALELIDFTVDDPSNRKNLKEILRVRELLVDYFAGHNTYQQMRAGKNIFIISMWLQEKANRRWMFGKWAEVGLRSGNASKGDW